MAKTGQYHYAADQELRGPHLSARSSMSMASSGATQRPGKKKGQQLTLEEAERKAHDLAQSNPMEALDMFTQVLHMKREQYGSDDAETRETELDLVEVCNRISQNLIQQGRTGEVGRYVYQSNELTQHSLPNADQNSRRLFLRAQMYNGMTCQAKAKGDIRMALKHCEKGLAIMLHLNILDQLPTCYLNVCALYSALGLHAEALKHAFLALQILRELIKNMETQDTSPGMLPSLSNSSLMEQEKHAHEVQAEPFSSWLGFEDAMTAAEPGVTHSRLTMLGTQLAITYFNIAVEQEYLLDFPTCIRTYQVAITSAEDFLGVDNPLTKKFKRTLKKVMKDEEKLQASADREEQQRKKQSHYKYGPTSVVSVHAVYKSNVYPNSSIHHQPAAPSGNHLGMLPAVMEPTY